MNELVERLTSQLETLLKVDDPRPRISAYHNMPYALFRYDPDDEFELRLQVTMLQTRLEQSGKRVLRISLAKCLAQAMIAVQPLEDWFEAERQYGTALVVDTIHEVLAEEAPLVEMVASGMPTDPDPFRDVVFITRTGSLFPVYRTFSLLEQLSGRVTVPTILFYPGTLDGAAGLRFMGVLEAEHNLSLIHI